MHRTPRLPILAAAALVLLCRCGDDAAVPPVDGGPSDQPRLEAGADAFAADSGPAAEGGAGDAAAADGGDPCPRLPAPADRDRFVVVAHPFAGAGAKSKDFEVLKLSQAGKLAPTSQPRFQLGADASSGEIVFTPDGKVGLVALGDGTVGVFSVDASGQVKVIQPAYKAPAYIHRLVLSPDGKQAYALSSQWRASGGGVYRLAIGCDGAPGSAALVAAAKLPYAMALLAPPAAGQALVVSRDVLASSAGHDVHLVDLGAKKVLAGVDAFGDDEAIVSAAALTHDGRYLLLADANAFSSTAGDRVAAVELQAGPKLRAALVLPGLVDPAALVTSPYDNAALVVGAQSNTITVLDYVPGDSVTPFKQRGPLTTTGKPQLPADVVQIHRGSLTGRVLIAENTAIRQVQFEASGKVVEVELYSLGAGLGAIPGAIGIQP